MSSKMTGMGFGTQPQDIVQSHLQGRADQIVISVFLFSDRQDYRCSAGMVIWV